MYHDPKPNDRAMDLDQTPSSSTMYLDRLPCGALLVFVLFVPFGVYRNLGFIPLQHIIILIS